MLSAEDIAAIKIAVEICNNPAFKREILHTPDVKNGKEYYRENYVKYQWDDKIETKTFVILENLGLGLGLQEKVAGFAILIALRMLTWADYHEGIVGFSRDFSISFFNSSLFTSQGIIDNKKAAAELIKDECLSIKQRYKLACLYCVASQISALFRQMTKEDQEEFYDFNYDQVRYSIIRRDPIKHLVSFWAYYTMGDVDKLNGEKTVDEYMMEKTIESGSSTAVEYCIERTEIRNEEIDFIEAAISTVRNRKRGGSFDLSITCGVNDWIAFNYRGQDIGWDFWIPSDYHIDILCLLITKMTKDQQIEFLKKDIEGDNYLKYKFEHCKGSNVLRYFLNWPYQDYFMKMANLMWEFLLEEDFVDLLLKICGKIESVKGTLKYGDGKIFNYRKLLKEFWCKSPHNYKRYVFSKNGGLKLTVILFMLRNFTYEDKRNMELFFYGATDEEKRNIILSNDGKNMCIFLMKTQKWGRLDLFVSYCIASKEQAYKFKRRFTRMKLVLNICINFVKNENWVAADSFINWIALNEEKTIQLKREMLLSDVGRRSCKDLIAKEKGVKIVEKFCEWFLPSTEELKKFKTELVFSFIDDRPNIYADLVYVDKLEVLDEFTRWCLSSEEEIRIFKKKFAYEIGYWVCMNLISYIEKYDVCNLSTINGIKFMGGRWAQVEIFLTWSFSSEEEINCFKRIKFYEEFGTDILFNLIYANKYEEAETFFLWLELSLDEIKKIKNKTLLSRIGHINDIILGYSGRIFLDYVGNIWEELELFLRWFLTDVESILEIKNIFSKEYGTDSRVKENSEIFEYFRDPINQFYLLLDGLLKDFGSS